MAWRHGEPILICRPDVAWALGRQWCLGTRAAVDGPVPTPDPLRQVKMGGGQTHDVALALAGTRVMRAMSQMKAASSRATATTATVGSLPWAVMRR